MAKIEISPIHRKMIDAFGHQVEVHLIGEQKPVVGKCINYTQPLDNDPEVASFDIAIPSAYHDSGYRIVEITEGEIESIIFKETED